MVHHVLARERFEATRAAIRRLDDVHTAIMLEGEDWKPQQVRAKSGISDPTANNGIYRADVLPQVMDSLKAEERDLIEYIGTTLRLIQAVRDGLGDKYADILDWLYVDCETWGRIKDLYHVSKSSGSEWRSVAFDWIDSIGIKNLLRGEREL